MTYNAPRLPSGIDTFEAKQQPRPEPVDDLSRFVLRRIHAEETQPAVDGVPKLAHATNGEIAHRYAGYVRQDMVAFRHIVALYCAPDAARSELRPAMLALANRWSGHYDFRDEWRLHDE